LFRAFLEGRKELADREIAFTFRARQPLLPDYRWIQQ
jgi:hypothetical protein